MMMMMMIIFYVLSELSTIKQAQALSTPSTAEIVGNTEVVVRVCTGCKWAGCNWNPAWLLLSLCCAHPSVAEREQSHN